MRILVFSDIHGDRAALEALMAQEADLYVAAGDLVSWGRGLDALGPILKSRAPRVWVLPGNHEHESDIEAFCARHGLNALHGRHFEMDGWRIAGLGHSSPTPFNTPGEYSEEEIAARLEKFAGLEAARARLPLPAAGDAARPGRLRPPHRQSRRPRVPRARAAGLVRLRACTRGRGRSDEDQGATRAVNAGRGGYLIELPEARRP